LRAFGTPANVSGKRVRAAKKLQSEYLAIKGILNRFESPFAHQFSRKCDTRVSPLRSDNNDNKITTNADGGGDFVRRHGLAQFLEGRSPRIPMAAALF
jgi:hypothetical protein